MKICYRIFFGFAIILAVGFYFLISWQMNDVTVQPKKAMEESLVDIVHILSAFLEENILEHRTLTIGGEQGVNQYTKHPNEEITYKINIKPFQSFIERASKYRFLAQIYEMKKEKINIRVYVTNQQGVVIFDSHYNLFAGWDFSKWRDIRQALRGEYGARTTRLDPSDPLSSIAYISAPIRHNGEIIGACTVAKAWKSINMFITTTRRKILIAGLLGFAIALLLSFFISRWITHPIHQLMIYANSIKEGNPQKKPELIKSEIKALGDSFEEMWISLEGKDYIEKYVQTLTHQLKGPLSTIRGAAELLQEDLAESDRQRFVLNIFNESNRMQRIVERMLELASIEQQRELRNVEIIDLSQLVKDIVEEMAVPLKHKEIILLLKVGEGFSLKGERFLIHQAVVNLIHNAVDFTPVGGTISIEIKSHWNRLFLIIRDSGLGIPDYAHGKVFEKFYSLQRPDTGVKSSGLGLSLVKEVAQLHNGDITLKNNPPPETGAVAILKLFRG